MAGVEHKQVKQDEQDMRLDRWLKLHYPQLPFGQMQRILRKGEVRVDGKRAKANDRLDVGQTIRIPPIRVDENAAPAPKQEKAGPDPRDEKLAKSIVIFKDKDVIGINKPAGLAVQGGSKTERHLDGMLDFLQYEAEDRPRLVHRLDKDTSGVMLLARNRQTATQLGDAFKTKDTRKVYWAVVCGIPDIEAGTINMPLSKGGGQGRERVFVDEEEGKDAITEYKVLERAGRRLALVALWPRTGRTHQLRAHMAAIGNPILGDGKYGGKDALVFAEGQTIRQLHLHAREIEVPDRGMTLKAPLPPHFRKTMDMLGFDETLHFDEDPFEDVIRIMEKKKRRKARLKAQK